MDIRIALVMGFMVAVSFATQCPSSHPYPFDYNCRKCASLPREKNGDSLRCPLNSERVTFNPVGSVRNCPSSVGCAPNMPFWKTIFDCKQKISFENGWDLPDDPKYGDYFIKYYTDKVKIESGGAPNVLGKITVDARGFDVDQSGKLVYSETIEQTSSFSNTVGASVSVGTSFKCGVPALAEGSVDVEVSASYEHSWGETTTRGKTWTGEFPCVAKAGTMVVCKVMAIKKKVKVPYRFRWSHAYNGASCIIEGLYEGVDSVELKFEGGRLNERGRVVSTYDLGTLSSNGKFSAPRI